MFNRLVTGRSKGAVFSQALAITALVLWTLFATHTVQAGAESTTAAAEPSQGQAAEKVQSQGFASGNPYVIADIAEKVTPAVVLVEVEWPQSPRPTQPRMDPFFGNFFGWPFGPGPGPETGPRVARGSGFIIDKEGYILTNQHVVGQPGDGQKIKVKLSTGSYQGEVDAKLVGADYQLDLAILKIEKPKEIDTLPVVALGNSEKSRPGEWLVAIGNPYGEQFEHTVTVGVLSAKGREIQIYDQENGRVKTYKNLMQTDAAINPGNSGGPLVNLKGEVVGINTAVNASAQGIGFAIPINTALDVKDQLITNGRVVRQNDQGTQAFLGVRFAGVTQNVAQALRLDEAKGAIVLEVVPGSAAAKAGLQVYDVITRVGDKEINTPADLSDAVKAYKPGDDALLVTWRQGRSEVLSVTFGSRQDG